MAIAILPIPGIFLISDFGEKPGHSGEQTRPMISKKPR
jgi:hypothetical protein